MRFLRNFRPAEEDEGKVFGIDVTHLIEIIHDLADIGLASPDEHHAVAEQVVGQLQLFLHDK